MSDSVSSYDITNDHEFDVLAHIHQHEQVKQRDIAGAIGLSLGMTNAILKRLANKGFISMRRINSRNIHYLVTPSGVDIIAKRSYRYLRRTVGHIVRYKETMRSVFREAAADPPEGRGATEVVLIGESDLDFLVEWCAAKEGLEFRRIEGPGKGDAPAEILAAVEEARAATDGAAGAAAAAPAGPAAETALLVVGERLPLAPRGTGGPEAGNAPGGKTGPEAGKAAGSKTGPEADNATGGKTGPEADNGPGGQADPGGQPGPGAAPAANNAPAASAANTGPWWDIHLAELVVGGRGGA
jgi:DNA-binding MarR family transcriptional regulator